MSECFEEHCLETKDWKVERRIACLNTTPQLLQLLPGPREATLPMAVLGHLVSQDTAQKLLEAYRRAALLCGLR